MKDLVMSTRHAQQGAPASAPPQLALPNNTSLTATTTAPLPSPHLQQRPTSSFSTKSKKVLQLAEDDQELIEMLKKRVEQQTQELEQREDNIASIQRNFENLSNIYQCKF